MRMADLHTLEVNPSTLSVNFYHPCQFDGYTDIDLQVRYIVTCIFFYPFLQRFSHNRMMDGWMTYDFTSFSTLLQSYQADRSLY